MGLLLMRNGQWLFRRKWVRLSATLLFGVGLIEGTTATLAGAAVLQASLVSNTASPDSPVVNGGQCYPGVPNPAACRRVLVLVNVSSPTRNWVYAGGIIDSVTDPATKVTTTGFHNVFRFDAVTHRLDTTWKPQFYRTTTAYTDSAVTGLASSSDGTTLFVAGTFNNVAQTTGATATARKGVAAVSTADGSVLPFNAKVCVGGGPCSVYDVKLVNGTLWLGGLFTRVQGAAVNALAFVDPVTAVLRPTQLPVAGIVTTTVGSKVHKIAVNPQATQAAMIGNFSSVGGATHKEVAVLDIAPDGTATANPWNAPSNLDASVTACNATDTWARGIDWDPTGMYFDIAASGGGGFDAYPALCDSFTRFASNGNPNTLAPLVVNATGFDSEFTVCDTGGLAYVGGHFKNQNHAVRINGVIKTIPGRTNEVHYGMAAITVDPTDANFGFAVQSWNNSALTGRGAGWASCLSIAGGQSVGGGVYIGGDAGNVGGNATIQRLALFTAP